MKHGGPRTGTPKGRSPRLGVALAPQHRRRLKTLSKAWGCSQAEAIRRALIVCTTAEERLAEIGRILRADVPPYEDAGRKVWLDIMKVLEPSPEPDKEQR